MKTWKKSYLIGGICLLVVALALFALMAWSGSFSHLGYKYRMFGLFDDDMGGFWAVSISIVALLISGIVLLVRGRRKG